MEKLIALTENSAVGMRRCNKAACDGCKPKNERSLVVVAVKEDNDNDNLLQLYYDALIQYHSSLASISNQDESYIHCT